MAKVTWRHLVLALLILTAVAVLPEIAGLLTR